MTRQAPLSSLQLPALGQHAGSSSAAAWRGAAAPAITELTCQESRLPAITSLGHACFEVWIAMELCDGGTLTEQLQHGFHCLPGSQQVDMVSAGDSKDNTTFEAPATVLRIMQPCIAACLCCTFPCLQLLQAQLFT